MKRTLSWLLALIMVLSCTFAFAEAEKPVAVESVYVQLSVDSEVAKNVMVQTGTPEEQFAAIEPVLALVSALGIKVTQAPNGLAIDLDLNGNELLSLAGASDEKNLTLASSLFPSYIMTISMETISQLTQQFMPAQTGESAAGAAGIAAAAGQGGFGGMDMNAMSEAAMKYVNPFIETCSTSVKPGEPESGSFEFEGRTYDTKTPVDVDLDAIVKAEKEMVEGLMQDETVLAMLQSFGVKHEDIKKSNDEITSDEHMPNVKVEVYSNSDGSNGYYVISESTKKDTGDLVSRYTMISDGEGAGTANLTIAEEGVDVLVNYSADAVRIEYSSKDGWFAVDYKAVSEKSFTCDIYAFEKEKPLATLKVTRTETGEPTLTIDTAGKTVVPLEDLMSGENPSEDATGLAKELTSGFGVLILKITKEVPDAAALFQSLMTSQSPAATAAEPVPAN